MSQVCYIQQAWFGDRRLWFYRLGWCGMCPTWCILSKKSGRLPKRRKVRPCQSANTRHVEYLSRQMNIDYAFWEAVDMCNFTSITWVISFYDVMCEYSKPASTEIHSSNYRRILPLCPALGYCMSQSTGNCATLNMHQHLSRMLVLLTALVATKSLLILHLKCHTGTQGWDPQWSHEW